MSSLIVLFLSLLLSLAITPLVIIFASRKKIVYPPSTSTIHKRPIPLLGGVIVWVSFFTVLWFFYPVRKELFGIFIAATLVFSVGLFDDLKKGVSSYLRFFIQVFASLIIVSAGIVFTFLPNTWWGKTGEYLLSIIWIVGICNAYNMLDGLDGLAVGAGVINAFFFFIIARITQQSAVAALAASLAGTCLGLLFYNFKPAKIFLGSAGSTFIGFILAVISIQGNWAQDNVIALSVPILILGIPIFDVAITTIVRIRNGQVRTIREWFDYKGRDHFHYMLLNFGIPIMPLVLFLYALMICLGLSAIVLFTASFIDALLLIVQAVFILTALFLFASLKRQLKTP